MRTGTIRRPVCEPARGELCDCGCAECTHGTCNCESYTECGVKHDRRLTELKRHAALERERRWEGR